MFCVFKSAPTRGCYGVRWREHQQEWIANDYKNIKCNILNIDKYETRVICV